MLTGASNAEFIPLTDPTNYPAQILLIHFILIEFAIGELALGPSGARFSFRRRASLAWLNGLLEVLPEKYQLYVQWPLKYARTLTAGLTSLFNLPNLHHAMPMFLEPSRSLPCASRADRACTRHL